MKTLGARAAAKPGGIANGSPNAAQSNRDSQSERSSPNAPLNSDSGRLSERSWQINWPRVAPKANRVAISRLRTAERASLSFRYLVGPLQPSFRPAPP